MQRLYTKNIEDCFITCDCSISEYRDSSGGAVPSDQERTNKGGRGGPGGSIEHQDSSIVCVSSSVQPKLQEELHSPVDLSFLSQSGKELPAGETRPGDTSGGPNTGAAGETRPGETRPGDTPTPTPGDTATAGELGPGDTGTAGEPRPNDTCEPRIDDTATPKPGDPGTARPGCTDAASEPRPDDTATAGEHGPDDTRTAGERPGHTATPRPGEIDAAGELRPGDTDATAAPTQGDTVEPSVVDEERLPGSTTDCRLHSLTVADKGGGSLPQVTGATVENPPGTAASTGESELKAVKPLSFSAKEFVFQVCSCTVYL